MKTSQFKDYSELPLFLNAEIIAKVLGRSLSVKIAPADSFLLGLFCPACNSLLESGDLFRGSLGISPASSYELMHESGFPVLKIGNRMIVPKEKFIHWVEENTAGGTTP